MVTCWKKRPRRIVGGLFALVVFSSTPFTASHACSDPSLHPEWAKFNDLVASLGHQPHVPITVLYRVPSFRVVGTKLPIKLAFRPSGPIEAAEFTATPSADLQLLDSLDNVPIADSKNVELEVLPQRSGVHFLKLQLRVVEQGTKTDKTILIPVAVDLRPHLAHDAANPVATRLMHEPIK